MRKAWHICARVYRDGGNARILHRAHRAARTMHAWGISMPATLTAPWACTACHGPGGYHPAAGALISWWEGWTVPLRAPWNERQCTYTV